MGAAAGCLAMSNRWILGSIGLENTVRAAATVNLACGLAGLFLAWRATRLATPVRETAAACGGSALFGKGPAIWIAIDG